MKEWILHIVILTLLFCIPVSFGIAKDFAALEKENLTDVKEDLKSLKEHGKAKIEKR